MISALQMVPRRRPQHGYNLGRTGARKTHGLETPVRGCVRTCGPPPWGARGLARLDVCRDALPPPRRSFARSPDLPPPGLAHGGRTRLSPDGEVSPGLRLVRAEVLVGRELAVGPSVDGGRGLPVGGGQEEPGPGDGEDLDAKRLGAREQALVLLHEVQLLFGWDGDAQSRSTPPGAQGTLPAHHPGRQHGAGWLPRGGSSRG